MGMLGGTLLSLLALFTPDLPVYYLFPLICTASLVASIVASLLTHPVEQEVLLGFYRSVRPFGLWGPVQKQSRLSRDDLSARSESLSLTVVNVLMGMLAIWGLYLFPMYLVGHWYRQSLMWFTVAIAAIVILRFTWYKNLPDSTDNDAT